MTAHTQSTSAKAGRRAALFIAGTGVYWILAIMIGNWLDLPLRTRALLDLIALAGFVFALVMVFNVWRARRNDER